jgi:hypothetical protein
MSGENIIIVASIPFHVLQSQTMDLKRVKSYNQVKICMCMKYDGYMIGVYGG